MKGISYRLLPPDLNATGSSKTLNSTNEPSASGAEAGAPQTVSIVKMFTVTPVLPIPVEGIIRISLVVVPTPTILALLVKISVFPVLTTICPTPKVKPEPQVALQ